MENLGEKSICAGVLCLRISEEGMCLEDSTGEKKTRKKKGGVRGR